MPPWKTAFVRSQELIGDPRWVKHRARDVGSDRLGEAPLDHALFALGVCVVAVASWSCSERHTSEHAGVGCSTR